VGQTFLSAEKTTHWQTGMSAPQPFSHNVQFRREQWYAAYAHPTWVGYASLTSGTNPKLPSGSRSNESPRRVMRIIC